ncbi:MAG: diadenylate cyclase CdaA [Eubacteriales bacterium]|nr:diadenylate cyclase CdaA [Eubacteriales bacterium]
MIEAVQNISVIDVVDIILVTVLIYQIFKLVKTTRASQVIKGLIVLLIAAMVSSFLQMKVLSWILTYILNAGAIIVVVLFQPEIRKGLEKIGRNRIFETTKNLLSYENILLYEKAVDELINAAQSLSKSKTGALIIIEGRTGLQDVEETGTRVDAVISSALLLNIFEPNTPLHDGAVIVKKDRVSSAGCFLPLSQNVMDKELGTRHRAGMGISEESDALVIIVSEETGIISLAEDGKMTRYMDTRKLREALERVYGLTKTTKNQKSRLFVRRAKHGEE